MKKRVIELALAVFCLGIFTGCGKTESDVPKNPDSSTHSESTVETTETSDNTDVESDNTDVEEQEKQEEQEAEDAIPWGKDSTAGEDYHDAIDWDNEHVKVCYIGCVKDYFEKDASEIDENITLAYRFEFEDNMPIPYEIVLGCISNTEGRIGKSSDTDVVIHTEYSDRQYVMDKYDETEASEEDYKTFTEMNDGHIFADVTFTISRGTFEALGGDPEKLLFMMWFNKEDLPDNALTNYGWVPQDVLQKWSSSYSDFLVTVPATSWEDIYKPVCTNFGMKNYDAGCFLEIDNTIYYIFNRERDSDYLEYEYRRYAIYVVDKNLDDMHTPVDTTVFTNRYENGTLFIGDTRWLENTSEECPYVSWEDISVIDLDGTINKHFEFEDSDTYGDSHRLSFGYLIGDGGKLAWTHNMGTDMSKVIGLTIENDDGTRLYIY